MDTVTDVQLQTSASCGWDKYISLLKADCTVVFSSVLHSPYFDNIKICNFTLSQIGVCLLLYWELDVIAHLLSSTKMVPLAQLVEH